MNTGTGKRLLAYALRFKKSIILALLLLAAAVSAELSGPFIAKTMIDRHILGIEQPWYKSVQGPDAVRYNGQWYKKNDHFRPGEQKGGEVRILQVGREYYFLPGPLSFDGTRRVEDGILSITSGKKTAAYQVQPLNAAQVFAFYEPEIPYLLRLIGLYLALLVASGIFTYGQKYLLQTSANRIIQVMRQEVFAHIQRLPVYYFDNLPAGKVVSRVTNDTEAVRDLYVTVLATFFTSTIYIAGIFVALFILDVRLALICLVIVPLLAVWIILYRRLASGYNQMIRSRLSDINGIINEAIQGMPIIQAFRREKQMEKEFEELNGEYLAYRNKLLSLNSLTSHNLVGFLRNLTFTALLWYFGAESLTLAGAVSFGALYAFVDYLNRLFQPVTGMVNQLANLESARVSAERVFELMDEKGEDIASGRMPRYKGDVAFEKVYFGYRENENVLKDISFRAAQGQTVALVGHTGSGKSSIMNLLFRFYDVGEGKITIDGVNIQDLPRQHIRRHMGIVLQDPFLFTGTIAENVSLGDPSISRSQVEKALRDVGADQIFRHLPKGYDEPVIEKGSTLSAGQRQLISFARALAFNPAILILDEATASIDTETEALIQSALDVLKKGRTTFIIAHRLSTIKNADQILVLDRGRIVERGSHDELMSRGGRYYQMYQLQQGAREEREEESMIG